MASPSPSYISSKQYIELLACLLLFALCYGLPLFLLPLHERDVPFQLIDMQDGNTKVIYDMRFWQEEEDSIVPTTVLLLLGVAVPLVIMLMFGLFWGTAGTVHASVCGFLVAFSVNMLLTTSTKKYVGFFRPNFYELCQFDEESLTCLGESGDFYDKQNERLSFPSGHSSISFCGLGFLALILLGYSGFYRRLRKSKRAILQIMFARLLVLLSCTPLLIAYFIAVSRVRDNHHHPADIIAGSLIGLISAFVGYYLYFVSPLSLDAGSTLYNFYTKIEVSTEPSNSTYSTNNASNHETGGEGPTISID